VLQRFGSGAWKRFVWVSQPRLNSGKVIDYRDISG